jgi:hypothetical protein
MIYEKTDQLPAFSNERGRKNGTDTFDLPSTIAQSQAGRETTQKTE